MPLYALAMDSKKYLPAIALLTVLIAAYFLGFFKYLDFKFLKSNFVAISNFSHNHAIISAVFFVSIYAFACAIGTPSLMVLSLSSGALFGGFLGGLYSGIAATIGSTILFWASQQAIGNFSKPKDESWLFKLEQALARHEFLNLLAFRLIPIAPLFIISIGAAGLGVKLRNFILATFLGLWCVETSFAFLGASIQNKLRVGGIEDWHVFITPGIILPFVAMSALAIISNWLSAVKSN